MNPEIGSRAGWETDHGSGALTGVRGAALGSPVQNWGWAELAGLVLPSPAHAGGLSLPPQFAAGNANEKSGTSIP